MNPGKFVRVLDGQHSYAGMVMAEEDGKYLVRSAMGISQDIADRWIEKSKVSETSIQDALDDVYLYTRQLSRRIADLQTLAHHWIEQNPVLFVVGRPHT